MASTSDNHPIDLIEPVPAVEIHADGVAVVRLLDTNVHIVLYADMVSVEGEIEHHAVARIIMRQDKQQEGAVIVAKALGKAMREQMARLS